MVVCEEAAYNEDSAKLQALEAAGVEVLPVRINAVTGRLDLQQLLQELGTRGIDSLLVEGGSSVHASFFTQGLANRLYLYVGAKVLGGGENKSPVGALPIERMADTIDLSAPTIHTWGNHSSDVLLEYEIQAKEEQT